MSGCPSDLFSLDFRALISSQVQLHLAPPRKSTATHRHMVSLSSQFLPIPSMSRRVINSARLRLSHPFIRIKCIDQWAVVPDLVLTKTPSERTGKKDVGLNGHLRENVPRTKNVLGDVASCFVG